MNYRIIGAICVVSACGSFGFLVAARYLQNIQLIRQLISALDYMACELQYRGTALPALCREAADQCYGRMKLLFSALSEELESQISPNVSCCMAVALEKCGEFPLMIQQMCQTLGRSLGRFDLPGQLEGLEIARKECRELLQKLLMNKENRIRSYQTLGLCAGAAIAILFV